MTIRVPSKAAAVLNVLHENGHEAYVVGGCVRDALMGREPNDWDVTTSALPEVTMALFEKRSGFRAIPTGIKHGTITVISRGEHIETTTFRIDGEYTDCRRPDHVDFTDSLKEDLARRDFTMNALRRRGRHPRRSDPVCGRSVQALLRGCAAHHARGAVCIGAGIFRGSRDG